MFQLKYNVLYYFVTQITYYVMPLVFIATVHTNHRTNHHLHYNHPASLPTTTQTLRGPYKLQIQTKIDSTTNKHRVMKSSENRQKKTTNSFGAKDLKKKLTTAWNRMSALTGLLHRVQVKKERQHGGASMNPSKMGFGMSEMKLPEIWDLTRGWKSHCSGIRSEIATVKSPQSSLSGGGACVWCWWPQWWFEYGRKRLFEFQIDCVHNNFVH